MTYHINNEGRILPCKAASPASCKYSNDPHFATEGEAEEYISKDFDTVFSFDSIIDKVKSVFGGKPKVATPMRTVPTSEIFPEYDETTLTGEDPQDAKRYAAGFALEGENGKQVEFAKIEGYRNIEGFRNTSFEIDDKQEAIFGEMDKELEVDLLLKDASVSAVMNDGADPFSDLDRKYFTYPGLKNAAFTTVGWKPENPTQAYVVEGLVDSILSQKTAAFDNAGITKSTIEKVLEKHGSDIQSLKFGENPESPSEGLISNYDEGWLYSFVVAAEVAKNHEFKDVETDEEKKETLINFLDEQKTIWEKRESTPQTEDFNGGAIDGLEDSASWVTQH